MENTFTPGPWHVATIDGGMLDDEIVADIHGCTINIASVFGEREYSTARPKGEEEPHYTVSRGGAAANARLIAAAPDLLLALEQALKIVDAYRRVSGGDGDIAGMNARAAIAKAKGDCHAR